MKFFNVVFFLITCCTYSQVQNKPIDIDGGNWTEILPNAAYFIDTTNSLNNISIVKKFETFKNNNDRLLTLYKQPHNLWVKLKFKNVSKSQDYWLGLYSQADTLMAYERFNEKEVFKFKKFSDYSKPSINRGIFNVRFHYVPFYLEKKQTVEVLLLIKNRKHYTNFYLDFTTPHDNLNWEKGFYWIISGFVSIFCFIALLCLGFGFVNKNWIFVNYAFYLILTTVFILHEELFISVFENPILYNILYKTNSLFLMVIAMGLNLNLFISLTDIKSTNYFFYKYLKLFYYFIIVYGISVCLIYYLFPNLNFLNSGYVFLWDFSLILNLVCVLLSTVIVFYFFYNKNKPVVGVFICLLLLVLNPVIYYLNYSKIINLYEIEHPNYYYYVILLEIISLGFFIFIQHRNKTKLNLILLQEKIINEEKTNQIINNTIIDNQKKILSNLSKDLHDDLGQKLSVINFSLENLKLKYNGQEIDEIKNYIVEVSNSIRDLSHWLNDFEFEKSSFSEILQQDAKRINKILSVNLKIHETDKINIDIQEKIIMFRVYQELINNSLKYANANSIKITIEQKQWIFCDNGAGFVNSFFNDGIGLKNIEHRLSLIKWAFEKVDSRSNRCEFRIYKL